MPLATRAMPLAAALAVIQLVGAIGASARTRLEWHAALSAGPELDIWQQLVAEYNQKNPDVEVVLTAAPFNEYYEKLPVVLSSGVQVDLVWMHYARWKDYAYRGVLRPLDDLLSKETAISRRTFPKVLVDTFTLNGRLYAIPKDHGGTAVIWYNIDLFNEAGVPTPWPQWTWDDFLSMAKKLTRDVNGDGEIDQWGTATLLSRMSAFFHERGSMIIRNFGGDTYTDDFKHTMIDHPQSIAAIQYLADLVNVHRVTPPPEKLTGVGDPFRAVKVAMTGLQHAGLGFFIRYEKSPISDYGIEWLPRGPGGQWQTAGATGFAIPVASRHPDKVWEFIKWAVSPEVQRRFSEHYRWGEGRADMLGLRFVLQERAGIKIERNWQRVWNDTLLDPRYNAVPMKVPVGASEINDVLDKHFSDVVSGKVSARDAATRAKVIIDGILAKYYR